MGFGSRALLAGGLGFAAAFVVACGGSNGLLTADQSSSLAQQLDSVSSAVKANQCGAANGAATALNNAVANLPPSVSTKLVQNLGQGAATISQLASQQCSGTTTTTTTTTSTPSTTTPTQSSTATTPPTTSTSSPTNTNPATGTATSGGGAGTGTAGSGGAGLTPTNGNGQ